MLWRLLALFLLLLAISLTLWAYWPVVENDANLTVFIPLAGEDYITRQVILRTPARLRLGETALVQLLLLSTDKEPVFDDCSLLTEASLELPGFRLEPAVMQQQAITANRDAIFSWQVIPQRSEDVKGVAPLSFYVYLADGQLAAESLLSAQSFEISVSSILGLSITLLRFLGVIGVIISLLLFWYLFVVESSDYA